MPSKKLFKENCFTMFSHFLGKTFLCRSQLLFLCRSQLLFLCRSQLLFFYCKTEAVNTVFLQKNDYLRLGHIFIILIWTFYNPQRGFQYFGQIGN